MPKAEVVLPDGTRISVEGNEQEVKRLLQFYQPPVPAAQAPTGKARRRPPSEAGAEAPLTEIVRLAKECPEAGAIEVKILDRTSQVDRILLPLYIVHEYMENRRGLTSGEISSVTKELGVPISRSNASTTLGGLAKSYVIGDRLKKRGVAIHYTLSRKGVQYIKEVLNGK